MTLKTKLEGAFSLCNVYGFVAGQSRLSKKILEWIYNVGVRRNTDILEDVGP